MSVLFGLPQDLVREVLSQWLVLDGLAALDSAVAKKTRPCLLEAYRLTESDGEIFDTDLRGQIYRWVARRGIRLRAVKFVGRVNFETFDALDKTLVKKLCLENVYSELSRLVNGCPKVVKLEFQHSYSTVIDFESFDSTILGQISDIVLIGSTIKDPLAETFFGARNLVTLNAHYCSVSLSNWCSLIQHNSKLKSISLNILEFNSIVLQTIMQNCRDIENISLSEIDILEYDLLPELISTCQSLKFLSLSYTDEWQHLIWKKDVVNCGLTLQDVSLEKQGIDGVLTACRYTLLHLSSIDETDRNIKSLILHSADTLQTLYVDIVHAIDSRMLHDILAECVQLRRLTIGMWEYWSDSDFLTVFSDPINIAELTLLCNLKLSTEAIVQLLLNCPLLTLCEIASKIANTNAIQEAVGDRMKIVLLN